VDSAGQPVDEIGMEPVTVSPPLPNNYYMVKAFDFGPDGTTFTPAIEITLKFDPSELPEGQIPVIVYYDASVGDWIPIEGIVNADAGTVTFSVEHFTTFAVLGRSHTNHSNTAPDMWVWIVIGIIATLALVLIASLLRRRAR